ncbi:zinc-binding alcohol dehydrogenase family protein [Jiella sp. MQZ9-1]|uniref:Zinc-binding alcohol dehydrogenase family protein n=1 Tax=Jiella flava TaxID=2816857 RepID=A0A939FXP2_9HYPH|nr:zinc-binding alcohol dehydrogenase family protein [Jiella flava]MBO0663420.1 zinc-binding alcohol dehydrogenase family protein [Jiella flava]MCD2471996.1 zinc-binding alcohol dehydrogenase family protein [Jiella flava]
MKALAVEAPGRIALVDRVRPEVAPDGWVLVDVARVGICGTDYHIIDGKHPFLQYPRLIGHELSGRAYSDGPGYRAGDLVIVNPYVSCGKCRACRKDMPNCCQSIEVLGVHRDGGLTERIAVPAGNLYPAEGLSVDQAAMVEFLAIGAHAVRRARLSAGAEVAVVGLGPIGIGAALFARIAGATVTLVDTNADRIAVLAARFGFERAALAGKDVDVLAASGQPDGFDCVFDATGHAAAMEASFGLVAHGGQLVFVGVVKDAIRFSDSEFHKREMSLLASRNATREDFETVAAAIRRGDVDTDALATHRARFDDIVAGLEEWRRDRSMIIKAIVEVA